MHRKSDMKQSLLIIFLPFSSGLYVYKPYDKYMKIYQRLVVLQFIFMFMASLYLIYLRLGVNII